jgi:hypothetical protein
MKRNKIMALVGAGVLTMGVVGSAFATDLLAGQVGIKLSDKAGTEQECADFPLEIGAGEIGLHFVLTGASADSGLLSASFSTDSFVNEPSDKSAGPVVMWDVVITGDGDTTLDSASTDITGDQLVLSHSCAGEESSSSTTSFESSEESSTDSQSSSSSSSTTSFESSEESTTDSQSSSSTTSFSDSVSDTTSQPPTDTIGNTGSGQQSSGLWMLLAALGVLGGSIIVLAPSKAKTKE